MKDIGSIFPLYKEDLQIETHEISQTTEGRIDYSLCREALFAVAGKLSNTNKIVLLPAYTCQTVIDPFLQQGWGCHYYSIKRNLRIDTEHLSLCYEKYKAAVVVVHPFLGMELNIQELDTLAFIKGKGAVLIEDITQCIYTETRPGIFDYFTGSYRKWYQVPDGGFIEGKQLIDIAEPSEENCVFLSKQRDAMFLRGEYFLRGDEDIKAISIRLNKDAVAGIGGSIDPHKMSGYSLMIKEAVDHKTVIRQRFENYKFLFENLHQNDRIEFACNNLSEVTTAPLYFPIYVEDRAGLQKKLAEAHIYAPVLWPVYSKEVLIDANTEYIYSHILMLPIDQRYGEEDMERIIDLLK